MTTNATKTNAITATLCSSSEFLQEMPEALKLNLTAEEVAAIKEARAFMASNGQIHTVNVRCTPPEIDGWRYDVCYLMVFENHGSYLCLFGKYDSAEQVEYAVDI